MGWVNSSWVDQIIAKTGRTISLTPVTETLDFRGEETLSDGTSSNITGVYITRAQIKNFDKWGEIDENADAYLIVVDSITILKNYKVTVDSMTFRVDNVTTYYGDADNATAMYKYAPLYRIS